MREGIVSFKGIIYYIVCLIGWISYIGTICFAATIADLRSLPNKTCRNMSPHPNLLPTGEKELKDIESAMIVWDPEIG